MQVVGCSADVQVSRRTFSAELPVFVFAGDHVEVYSDYSGSKQEDDSPVRNPRKAWIQSNCALIL